MIKILGLDLGTRCGWALLANGVTESGVQVFDVRRGESPGMRFLRFNRWLHDVCQPHVDVIAYEAPHHRGGAATEVACGFSTRVHEYTAKHGGHHINVHTATLKKFATGSGRAGKDKMIEAARQYKTDVTDDNEADALHVLAWALAEVGGRDAN